jgi:hypothetical protein
MSVDQISSRPRRAKISLNTTIFIAIAVIGFAVLHIIGGNLLQRQTAAAPSIEGSSTTVHGD